ncbi:unnamed protein product [Paramecium sonneborni]|uniref:Transmembrane protein n=1 Tax=Paramecium sonneborni TaxID=65129 RepID=A0A8S1QE52_9CILI|nr:unnamed protein product [Paramecium sonneborni]
MFREHSVPIYQNAQQSPFKNAAMQSIDLNGNIGYKPEYLVKMQQQQQNHNNYRKNKNISSQVKPIHIAGPISQNQNATIFQGPQYLNLGLFQPIEKNKVQNDYQPNQIIQVNNSYNLQSKQQLEENITIRNQILKQWNFIEEQKQQKTFNQSSEYEHQNKISNHIYCDNNSRGQYNQIFDNKLPIKNQQTIGSKSIKFLEDEKPEHLQKFSSIKRENEKPQTNFTTKIDSIVIQKQTSKEKNIEIVNKAMSECASWILNFAEKDLNQFWSKEESLNWLENDQLSEKEKKYRIDKVKLVIQKLSIIILENLKESNFNSEFFSFLAQITQNFKFPPDQYFFNFEISRLEFNSSGTIKNIKVQQQKMVLAFFIMIRILGFTILYAPWTLGINTIKKTSILETNSLIIVSVIQELVVGDFREIKVLKDNQNHLRNELKINARPQGPLKIIPDPKTQEEKMELQTQLEPLIYPTYTHQEMKDQFEKQIEWVENMRDIFDEIYTKIIKMTNSWHKNSEISLKSGKKWIQ